MRQIKRLRLANTAFYLICANLVGKGLGFFRDILISGYYGTSAQTDAFFLAFSIPTILIGVFTSSADSSIVPQYTGIAAGDEGRKGADQYFSNIVTILTIIATAMAVFTLFLPEKILLLFAPTFQGEVLSQACEYLRLFSFVGLFHIWYCFFCAYLLCHERTTLRIILTMSTNVIVVLTLLCIHDTKMYAVSIAYLAAAFLSAALPMYASFKAGFRYPKVLSLKKYHFPEFFKLFLPIMGSALLADLLLFCDRFLSSFLEAGSLSALNYGSKVINIFDNIVVVGIGVVLIPAIANMQVHGKKNEISFTISAISFCATLCLLPIAVLCTLYSREIISFIYFRGAFTEENVISVGAVLCAYGMQILFITIQMIFVKTFHALQETRIPFYVSLIAFFSNIILSALLMQFWQVFGIAVATTISTFLGMIFLIWQFKRRIGFSHIFFSWKNLCKLFVCGLSMPVLYKTLPLYSSPFLTLVISGGLLAVLYFALVILFFRKEIKECGRVLMQK